MGGLHPVVAIYATFLNRAFDQVLMDVALHKCGVTFVLDRAGVTGDDGASHNGMWDMSILQVVPGPAARRAPRRRPRRASCSARRSTSTTPRPWCASRRARRRPTSRRSTRPAAATCSSATAPSDVLIVAVGSMAAVASTSPTRLVAQGIGVTVVDPRWVKPVDPAIVELAREHRLVVSVEDNGEIGGCGAILLQTLNDERVHTPFRLHGIPQEFLDHAKRDAILERIGLTAQALARGIVEDITALDRGEDHPGAESDIHVASPVDRGTPGLTPLGPADCGWPRSRPSSPCCWDSPVVAAATTRTTRWSAAPGSALPMRWHRSSASSASGRAPYATTTSACSCGGSTTRTPR